MSTAARSDHLGVLLGRQVSGVRDEVGKLMILFARYPICEEVMAFQAPVVTFRAKTTDAQDAERPRCVGVGQQQDDRAASERRLDRFEEGHILEVRMTSAESDDCTWVIAHDAKSGGHPCWLPPPVSTNETLTFDLLLEGSQRLCGRCVVRVTDFVNIDETRTNRSREQGSDRGLPRSGRPNEYNSPHRVIVADAHSLPRMPGREQERKRSLDYRSADADAPIGERHAVVGARESMRLIWAAPLDIAASASAP